MGKSSEVAWMKKAELEFGSERSQGYYPEAPHFSYHEDDLNMFVVDETQVDATAWPTPLVANALVAAYFETVHPSYPILFQKEFEAQFQGFLLGELNLLSASKEWLTLLNLVFAIGARYAHLTSQEYRGDERDHLVYYARARALGLTYRAMYEPPNLQTVRALSLLGIYLISNNQINKYEALL
jgi:hypothetical protein